MSHQKPKDWSKITDEENEELETSEDENQDIDNGKEKLKLEYPDYEELEKKLIDAEKEIDKSREDFMRARAEIENIKRRSSRDVENAYKYSLEKFVLALLPIMDSLEMGITKIKESGLKGFEKILEGNELTLKLFQNALTKFGVEVIDPVGQPFDPSYHQAMSSQETDEIKANHVLHVMQKGYTLNGRLVRPALVVVSKEPE